MVKKIFFILVILLCFGCGNERSVVVKKADGDSLTYMFFKDFDVNNYLVYFFDRNVSVNDNTKIIFGRDGDKYYYEIDGENSQKIIQMDGYKYVINKSNYYKEEGDFVDYSKGILPDDIFSLKTSGYVTGKESIFNKKYTFERFKNGKESTTYYFEGKRLVYVKYSGLLNEVLLKFNKFGKVSSKLFEIDDLIEISY